MVDEKSNYWKSTIDELKSLKNKKDERVIKLDIILAEQSENKEKERNFMEQIIKEARADENPLRVGEYASEVVKKGDTRYNIIEAIRDHIIGEIHTIDYLEKEIRKRIVLSSRSFSNEKKVTDKKKEEKWQGGKNE